MKGPLLCGGKVGKFRQRLKFGWESKGWFHVLDMNFRNSKNVV